MCIKHLGGLQIGYAAGMHWKVVRATYARLMGTRTQGEIAHAANVPQNYISRVINNHNRGPNVETFLKAVVGLGLTPAQFFTIVERGLTSSVSSMGDTRPHAAHKVEGAGLHGPPADPALLQRQLAAIIGAVEAVRTGVEVRQAHERSAGGRRRSTGVGRKDSAPVRRVK
jgi:hypothetical protein